MIIGFVSSTGNAPPRLAEALRKPVRTAAGGVLGALDEPGSQTWILEQDGLAVAATSTRLTPVADPTPALAEDYRRKGPAMGARLQAGLAFIL